MPLYSYVKIKEKCYALVIMENNIITATSEPLFEDEKAAEDFARLCNELELSPMHLSDIAEDILKEKTCHKRFSQSIEAAGE